MPKKLTLDFDYFAIRRASTISSADLINLRQLYGPIIGGLGVLLYEYLMDLSRNSDFANIPFNFSSLNLFLNSHEDDLNKSRKELEALGLINTFKDNKKAITVFVLQRPLTANEIIKNPFITKLLVKHIGQGNFEKLTRRTKVEIKPIFGSELEDVSSDFFTIYDETLKDSSNILKSFFIAQGNRKLLDAELKVIGKKNDIYTPLPVGNIKYSNDYQALIYLDSSSFIRQMLQRNENEIELLQLKKWLDINFESKTLNMIIFYAIKRRGDSWYKYVNSLISELNANNITNFDDVEKYLDGKFKSNVKTKPIYDEKTILKSQFLSPLKYD
ncbi:DnaD domain protein [Mycoplasmopsis cynos]|uniref:DnaD domain-containing protein n=2 Tax=Mycoplasmopsis cynos TaxID=171284 RepID=A0A449AIN1_9BACT|nr:DnaD domain protein [Mycoplasmopsis cynos]VEU64796.1 DnaD domain-containing protein [Mycoplasmopsis cynos]